MICESAYQALTMTTANYELINGLSCHILDAPDFQWAPRGAKKREEGGTLDLN